MLIEVLMNNFILYFVVTLLAIVYYIYDGYGRLLGLLVMLGFSDGNSCDGDQAMPHVTIVLPVFNEEQRIKGKIENLLAQNYDRRNMEIVVVSDGSTDGTEGIIEQYTDRGVRLIRTPGRYGKSLAQNLGVAESSGEILVLTDAAVEMAGDCLMELIRPFCNPNVGCTTAKLLFRSGERSDTGEAQGIYWKYELKLRKLESSLGLLATAAGPAMAIRRDLWQDLDSQYGDDCVLPLDVVLAGKKVLQAEDAVAWDQSFESVHQELKARVRMTIRNWNGTWSRSELLNPWKYPKYAFTLWSHKIIRWLSPVFMAFLGFSVMLLAISGEALWPLVLYVLLVLMACIGYWAMKRGVRIPGLSILSSFLVANLGFAEGLRQVMAGRVVKIYDNK